MKTQSATDLSIPIRAIIVAFRVFFKLGWTEISQKLGVNPSTIQQFFERTQKLAAGSADFWELLAVISPKDRHHPAPIAAPGSKLSHDIRRSALTHRNWHRSDAVNYDRAQQGLTPLSDSVIRRVCLEPVHAQLDPELPKPLKRLKRPRKTSLSDDNINDRLAYCNALPSITGVSYEAAEQKEWVLGERDSDLILIAVDEYCLDFGGSPGQLVTTLQGSDTYEVAQPQPATRFKLMQWGAASSVPTKAVRPQVIWEAESDNLTLELTAKLEKQNKKLQETVEAQRRNARSPGTLEYNYLQQKNKEIDVYNDTHFTPTGRKCRKHYYTPERLFQHKDFVRDHAHGGLDFVWYAFEVYERLLFPYYRAIKAEYPGRRVMVSEDNAGPHLRARQLLAAEIAAEDIQFFDWPGNSPDLHVIEDIQKHHKNYLEDLRFSVDSAAKATKDHCKAEMQRVWQQDQGFNEVILEIMNIGNYMRLASLCLAHQGNNNFKD